MEYLNFDLEIAPQHGGFYPVSARSEQAETRHMMRLPLQDQALEFVLLRLQNVLLRSVSLHRAIPSPEEQLVQDFGRTLFESLLAENARRLYDASLAQASQQGKGLRLRLRILAPELATLPWEFLYDPLQQEFVCLLPDTVIVRYLESALPPPPLTVSLPLNVLAMIASPSDQARLDIAREKARLVNALGPLEQKGQVRISWVEGQTVQALHQALMQREWHIFHFIGHGGIDPQNEEGVLALVNAQGRTHLLNATDLGRLLALRPSLRLVVLNACLGAMGNKRDLFSSTAAALASKRIPAVLAMQYDISDQAMGLLPMRGRQLAWGRPGHWNG
jgi:CHAT domain-containing protein